MSTISHTKFLEYLRRWGVEYVEHSRRDRCLGRTVPWHEHEARRSSDCARRGWDAHGIAIHHTGGPTSWTYVWDGDIAGRGIPGPLYTGVIYEDGRLHLTGWGVSNNVGKCDRTVRNRVLAGRMPTSGEVRPGGDDYSAANSEFYGLAYRGTSPNAAQRETMRRVCAAICEAHGPDWDGGSIAGHRELTRRKPDPEGEEMGEFRTDVNELLAAGPSGRGTDEEEDVRPSEWTEDDKRAVREAIHGQNKYTGHRHNHHTGQSDDWHQHVNTLRLAALQEVVAELVQHDSSNPLTRQDLDEAVERGLRKVQIDVEVAVRDADEAADQLIEG